MSTQKEPVSIQMLMPEDVDVSPEIAKYDYESACEMGKVKQLRGILPGYSIISGEYSLVNGISVGMTKTEVLDLCPAMAILDTEGNAINEVVGHMGWSHISYPHSPVKMDDEWDYDGEKDYYWESQFDYIMIADVKQESDGLPIYLALMMKEDKVSAITFYCPTAGL